MHLNLNISGYEGPLDLLLDLSKKQKVDIKQISILELANQYLDFINNNINNLKLSADYLVMASFLAFLKSKLLLPDEKEEVEILEEDLSQRLVHYNAIKLLSKKIFELPEEGKDFYTIKIRNEFKISNKVVPNATLQDLILNYSEISQKKNTMKILIDNNEIFSIEDGIEWLKKFMNLESSNWDDLFNLLPLYRINKTNKKSAKLALFQASLDQVNQGKIEINQKFHFDKIMIRLKK
jgi:segregation and condensation protein A